MLQTRVHVQASSCLFGKMLMLAETESDVQEGLGADCLVLLHGIMLWALCFMHLASCTLLHALCYYSICSMHFPGNIFDQRQSSETLPALRLLLFGKSCQVSKATFWSLGKSVQMLKTQLPTLEADSHDAIHKVMIGFVHCV